MIAAALAAGCSSAAVLALLARSGGGPATAPQGHADALWRRGAAVVAAVLLLDLLDGGSPVLTLLFSAVTVAGLLTLRNGLVRARERRLARAGRDCVAAFVSGLATELRAGREARAAVGRMASTMRPSGWLEEIAAAAASAGDVAAALLRAAASPGGDDLREVAACWQVAERSGAGLAAGLETVASAMAERENFRDRLDAELAGVRAGGWVLGALPLLGFLLGAGMGARPWEVIFGTRIGGALCCAGLLLDALGVLWLRRMIRSVREAS